MAEAERLFDFYYHSDLAFIYDTILSGVFLLSTVVYVIVLMVMITKSKKLGKFKWVMISNITASYSVNLVMAAFKVRPLFPAMAFSFQHPLGLAYPWLASLGFVAFCFTQLLISINLTIAILYKYLSIFPLVSRDRFKNRYLVFLLYGAIMVVIIVVLILLTTATIDSTNPEGQLEVIQATFPDIEGFVGKCLLLVFTTDLSPYFKIISLAITTSYFFAVISFIRMKFKLNQISKITKANTMKLQLMLFYSVIAETTSAAVLLGAPASVSMLSAVYQKPYSGHLSLICLLIMSSHSICSHLLMAATVKPYRRTLKFYFKTVTTFVQPYKK